MSSSPNRIVTRRLLPIARARMADDPVLLLEGPRTVGKSTLLRAIAAEHGAVLIDLDDPATQSAVATDPSTFVAGPETICVDEYQKAPIILDAIKAELNRGSRPGRFVLTGSTRHDALPSAAQALTGRLTRVRVYPLSQGELAEAREQFLEQLFLDPGSVTAASAAPATTRASYIERTVAGGMPMALARRSAGARGRWFDEYITLTLERDVRELSRIRHGALLPGLLLRLAGQTGQILNVERAARDSGLDHSTAESYVRLLETVFLIHRLPAWGRTLRARAAASPKFHVLDSGVAARLLRLTPEKLGQRDPAVLTEFGHLLETFAVGELLKQASWMDGLAGVGHWRTHDGDEIDLVVEADDGAIVVFEVKAASRVPTGDLRGMRKLRDSLGDTFRAGVVLYTGTHSYTADDRLHVVPIDRLWLPVATG